MNLIKTILLTSMVMISGKGLACEHDHPDTLSRPIESSYGIELGGTKDLHTYLSPVSFTGFRGALTGHWMKAVPFNPEHVRMQFDALIEGAVTGARYGRNRGYDGGFGVSWSMLYSWRVARGVNLSAGGGPAIEAGAFYVPSGGNNPVSARASVGLDLKVSATWRQQAGRMPIKIVEEASIPSLSVFFSQQYGESFYEIYIGNHSGLAHCGWWGNRFGIDNFIGVDMEFSRGTLRVGYSLRFRNEEVCGLINRRFSNSVGIAFTPRAVCKNILKKTQYAPY